MRSRIFSAALLLTAALAGAARADFSAPGAPDVRLPSLEVFGEDGARGDLRAMAAGAPTLLLPIYTRCAGTCPITTEALREALAGRRGTFRVILLSFDPQDKTADLKAFRARHELPGSWRLVREADAGATRSLFDLLNFRVMTARGGFDHTDAVFAFSPGGVWAGSFYGGSFPQKELDRAHRAALDADGGSFAARLERPGSLIALAFAALILCLFAVLGLPGAKNIHR